MRVVLFALALVSSLAAVPAHAAPKCSPDAVPVGDVCVDKYEASVWLVNDPGGVGKSLVKRIEKGKATPADLMAGATQLGCFFIHTSYPPSFPPDGNWTPVFGTDPPTPGIYAASVAGVVPSECTSQLQAMQACTLAGKHLITNAEWQAAAAGTPDAGNLDDATTTCATNSATTLTGSRSACRSRYGAYDMVGNTPEQVADWFDLADGSTTWQVDAGITDGDFIAFSGNPGSSFEHIPGAALRGGGPGDGVGAGTLAGMVSLFPTSTFGTAGFRCARH